MKIERGTVRRSFFVVYCFYFVYFVQYGKKKLEGKVSDGVFIPGLSNKYNSQATIEKIMNKKREKVTHLNEEKQEINEQRKSMGEVASRVLSLDKAARKLYGMNSSFEDKIAQTDSDSITAKATKSADIGEHSVRVFHKALSHKIASDSINQSSKIEAGDYKISVGEKNVTIRFSGGNIEAFHNAVSEQGKDVLKSSIIYDTSKTVVMVLESKIMGRKSQISFGNEKSKELFQRLGFYEEMSGINRDFSAKDFVLEGEAQEQVFTTEIQEVPIYFGESYFLKLPQETEIKAKKSIHFQFRLAVSAKTTEEKKLNQDETDHDFKNEELSEKKTIPEFSTVGDSVVMGVELPGDKFILNIPEYSEDNYEMENETITKINQNSSMKQRNLYFIEIETDSGTVRLDNLDITEDWNDFTIGLGDILPEGSKVKKISFKNNDPEKILNAGNVRLFDDEVREGNRFRHELTKASDAVLELDGLRISRDSNTIDDLLKGVTLNVFGATTEEVKLQVDRDYPKIVNDITDFLSEYNQLIDMINTRTAFVGREEKELSEEEKEQKKGTLSGEQELKNLASKLRIIAMNSYPTKYGVEFSMLSHIGISTNETGRGLNANKLGGTLEFDEDKFADKFIEAMEKYPDGVKELFANDNNQDFVPDTGIAVEINKLLKGYMEKSTGYFDIRDNRYQSQREAKEKEIDKYEEKLKEEEKKLKEQFFKMEKAGQELEDSKKKFENMNK